MAVVAFRRCSNAKSHPFKHVIPPGEFEGPAREDIEDLSPEEIHTIVGWRKFYHEVCEVHNARPVVLL
jgi:hypothetical protein